MSITIELESGGRYEEHRKVKYEPYGLYLWDDDGKWELIPWHRILSIKPSE